MPGLSNDRTSDYSSVRSVGLGRAGANFKFWQHLQSCRVYYMLVERKRSGLDFGP